MSRLGSAIDAAVILAFGLIVTFCADLFVWRPLIIGSMRLPFLLVLLGILGGVKAWRLIGLFAGPVIMAALVLLWQVVAGKRPSPLAPRPPTPTEDLGSVSVPY